MYKNAIEKISKFYELDLNKNSHADEIFDVLNEIIPYNSVAIFYLLPNALRLEFGKNFSIYEDIKISDILSKKLYSNTENDISDDVKKALKISENILISKLTVRNTVFGILVITKNEKEFSKEDKVIFNTCSKIIGSLIKDIEISKVLKLQMNVMKEGLAETHKAYEAIKRQNKKIKSDEKIQNQFIANISHDLRTPLNSIIGFSEALSGNIFGELNPKQKEYVEDIRISGIRLLGMINEILDISKLESKTTKLATTEINLAQLINEVSNILQPLLQKKELKLTIKSSKNDIILNADYTKLQQIIFNILGNAIKFSHHKGTITLKITQNNTDTKISIKDSGIGIDKKYHKKIFNKFFQVNTPSVQTEPSTGLGLTISKEFVKLHGGDIKLVSEINKGCEFIITIPNN